MAFGKRPFNSVAASASISTASLPATLAEPCSSEVRHIAFRDMMQRILRDTSLVADAIRNNGTVPLSGIADELDPMATPVALRDLPEDYNAPARLALLYRELNRPADALAAIERAQKKVYGPRGVRVLEIKASIYERLGDRAATRRSFEEALRVAESLPKAQQSDKTIARLKNAIAKLG